MSHAVQSKRPRNSEPRGGGSGDRLRTFALGALTLVLGIVLGFLGDRYLLRIWSSAESALGGGPMHVNTSYPWSDCTATPMAVMPDDPDVQSHPSVPAVTQDLLWSLDAAMPWERSRITLLIVSDVPNQTLVIEEIRAEVVRQWDERPKQMIYDSGHGCGDIKERVFALSLHGGSAAMVDKGVVGIAGEDADAQLRNTPLGSSFTVSDTDPARVMVDVEACDQNYEFVLEVKYRSGGAEFIERIDDRGRPFRISGVPPESYWTNDWQAAPGDRLTGYYSLEELSTDWQTCK